MCVSSWAEPISFSMGCQIADLKRIIVIVLYSTYLSHIFVMFVVQLCNFNSNTADNSETTSLSIMTVNNEALWELLAHVLMVCGRWNFPECFGCNTNWLLAAALFLLRDRQLTKVAIYSERLLLKCILEIWLLSIGVTTLYKLYFAMAEANTKHTDIQKTRKKKKTHMQLWT